MRSVALLPMVMLLACSRAPDTEVAVQDRLTEVEARTAALEERTLELESRLANSPGVAPLERRLDDATEGRDGAAATLEPSSPALDREQAMQPDPAEPPLTGAEPPLTADEPPLTANEPSLGDAPALDVADAEQLAQARPRARQLPARPVRVPAGADDFADDMIEPNLDEQIEPGQALEPDLDPEAEPDLDAETEPDLDAELEPDLDLATEPTLDVTTEPGLGESVGGGPTGTGITPWPVDPATLTTVEGKIADIQPSGLTIETADGDSITFPVSVDLPVESRDGVALGPADLVPDMVVEATYTPGVLQPELTKLVIED